MATKIVRKKDKIIVTRTYIESFTIELDTDGKVIEPSCETCGSRILRQKCFFELGSDCPRHGMSDAFKLVLKDDPMNHNFKQYGYDHEICSLCMKPKVKHDVGG